MRRFWTYIGSVFPLAATAEYASGSVDPYMDVGPGKHTGNSDAAAEDEAAGATEDGGGQPEGRNGPSAADVYQPSESLVLESANDAVTQEIRGLLNDLDRMSGSAEVDSPVPAAMYGPSTSEMYAPASPAGAVLTGSGSDVAALAETEDDPVEEPEAGADEDTETGGDNTGAEDSGSVDADDTMVEPDVEDVDSMLVLLGGAAGGGDGTTSDGDIDLEIVDYGTVTVAYGKAEFTATSDWDGTGHPPVTYAETYLDVYDADLVFFYHVDDEPGSSQGEGGEYTDTSTLYVVAIDFEDDHPLANEFDLSDDNGYEHEFDPGLMLAAYDGTPEEGYFSHPLLDGIPFLAFSQYYNQANGEVHLDGSGADLSFLSSSTMGGNDDSVVLVGDVTSVEDLASSSDLVAQTEYGELSISVSGFGPDTYATIDGQIVGIDDGFSGITGLAIGIA